MAVAATDFGDQLQAITVENAGWFACVEKRASHRRWIQPADRDHRDVIGRQCRSHETFHCFSDAANDFGACATSTSAEDGFQSGFAEEFVDCIARFGYAVREEIDHLPGRERELARVVNRIRFHSKNDALGTVYRGE
jgi:hypothetical protein